jgi:hypothetical protein
MNADATSAVGSQSTGGAPTAIGVGIERPRRIDIAKDDVKNGLGKLVLTLVELVRQIVERQAIRRVEGGSLNEAEIERLGTTLMQLSEQMDLLKKHFGLRDEDLNIDLGPLGRLL